MDSGVIFTLLGERTRTDCPNCDKFIIYNDNTIIVSYGNYQEKRHFHIGETIQPACCPEVKIDVPVDFPSDEYMHEYVRHLHSRMYKEPLSLILKSLVLVEVSDEVSKVLRLDSSIAELMREYPYERVDISKTDQSKLKLIESIH